MAGDGKYSAWVEILPDFSKVADKARTGLTNVLGDAGSSGGFLAGNAFKGTFGQILGGFVGGNLITGIGYTIGRTISNGIQTAIGYGLQSIDFASGLQQSQGAVDSIFKESAATVHKYALSADKDLGLSENAYSELASLIGAQLKNGGIAIDQLAGKTSDIIKIGADLSAQFGGSTRDAVQALSSAFKGERDPIERYGVSLTQSVIDAKAAELGYSKVNGVLTTQATQAATLAVIMQQTADATGQFAAQSGTLAEQQQILNAQLENAQTRLGTALLPTATDLAVFANEELVPILSDALEKVGPKLASAIEDNLPKIKQLIESTAEGLPGAIQTGIDALSIATDVVNTVKPVTDFFGLGGPFSPLTGMKTVSDGFTSFYANVQQQGVDFWNGFAGLQSDSKELSLRVWGELFQGIHNIFTDEVPKFRADGDQIGHGFADGITGSKQLVIDAAHDLADAAVTASKNRLSIHSPSEVFREIGSFIGQGMVLGIDGERASVASSVGSLVSVPNLASSIGGTASTAPGATGAVRDVHFNGVDPTVVYAQFKQEIGGRLAIG